MDATQRARAIAAASSLGQELDLSVSDAVVVHNSNILALRLLPCDVFARTAVVGHEVAALEVSVAQQLDAASAPTASLHPRVEPRVYLRDNFAVTFWTYYESLPAPAAPPEYADALYRLHAAMRSVDLQAPHFTHRIAEAEVLLTQVQQTPSLADADRALLLYVLSSGREAVCTRMTGEQLLHGEPHPGNLLNTRTGPVFIDFETCCRGPIEFDVAHVGEEVSARYPGADPALLQECRRLILAMVAAWRFDVRDEFPDGHRHGLDILRVLRNGPPWPSLGALAT